MACSVWIFYLEKTNRMNTAADASTILLICSFAITGITFYGNSMNYKERALLMKSNYISLGKLAYEIEATMCSCSQSQLVSAFQRHSDKYSEILSLVENHVTFDYLGSQLSLGKSINRAEKFEYRKGYIKYRIVPWIVLLSPFCVILWLVFMGNIFYLMPS